MLDSYKLKFSFNRSQGETADKFIELVEKYNELGANFSQLVKDVKRSTDMTREGIKNADQHISLCWDSLENSFVEEGEPSK